MQKITKRNISAQPVFCQNNSILMYSGPDSGDVWYSLYCVKILQLLAYIQQDGINFLTGFFCNT